MRLKQTGAKLIFASTTPVPECDAGKYVKDSERPYNDVARKVMADEGVVWNDLWGLVKPQQEKLQGKRNVHFLPIGLDGDGQASGGSHRGSAAKDERNTKANAPSQESAQSQTPRDDASWLLKKGHVALFTTPSNATRTGILPKRLATAGTARRPIEFRRSNRQQISMTGSSRSQVPRRKPVMPLTFIMKRALRTAVRS